MILRRGAIASVLSGALLLGPAISRAAPGGQSQPPAQPGQQAPIDTLGQAPLSPQEREVLAEVERDLLRYMREAERHESRVYTILWREYERRRKDLEARYAESLEAASAEKRRRHLETIALLEAFLEKYPDQKGYTPDAMFRLASLYLDEAEYQYEQAFEERMAALLGGGSPQEPAADDTAAGAAIGADNAAEPGYTGPDYSKALALWRQITHEFPAYRQRAGTLYLLGYYLKQTGHDREALAVYRGLACKNKFDPNAEPPPAPTREEVEARIAANATAAPRNPYVGCEGIGDKPLLIEEAWVRGVGDIHFNTPGELDEAIAAYEKVARDKDSEYYDEALYKLAWSYYRNDDFLDGIKAFDESVAYSDKLVAEGEEPLELRKEAVQYIAVSFTDPWSVSESPDPQRSLERALEFYNGRFDEPHVRDVFEQLGDTFEILQAHEQAIASWRLAIEKWPLDPRNPVVHQKIVGSLEALGDKQAADEEAARLVARYGVGSQWYEANRTNREAMENFERIGERMLRSAAENMHRRAQLARQDYLASPTPEGEANYVELYGKAAALYQQFIDQYPTAPEVYEFTYRLGETKFFARKYREAIGHYTWVRDHRKLSEERFELAARSIVQSYQALIDAEVKAGKLPDPTAPTVEDLRAMPAPIQPLAIPELYRQQQQALDEYQQLVNDPERAPNMAFESALISYRFLHLDEAIDRFGLVMSRFCSSPLAAQAKDGLLAIYEARGDDAKFEATTQAFIAKECGTAEDIALAKAQSRSKDFRDASELFSNNQYDAAALAFYRYYKTAPEGDPNRPVALYNAAIAYDRSGHPNTAIYLFEEFTSNKEEEFRQSEYYVEALYLTAVSQQNAFDYDASVKTYLEVARIADDRGRKPPPGGRTLEQIRLDALYNAAVLREIDRDYGGKTGAISLYRRYLREEPDRRKQDRALWAIARVYTDMGNERKAIDTYEEWRRKYGNDVGNDDDYVFTFYKSAQLHEKRNSNRAANRARRATIDAWEKIGSPKGTRSAEMAAEYAFYFAEQKYKTEFERFKIRRVPSSPEQAKKILDRLDALTFATRDEYTAISRFETPYWGLAALVRVGDTLFYSGQKVLEAPVPKNIERLDRKYPEKGILFQYKDKLRQSLVDPKQDAAKEQWIKVVDAARQAGVSNEWTELALRRLHDFVSAEEYPVIRDGLVEGTEVP